MSSPSISELAEEIFSLLVSDPDPEKMELFIRCSRSFRKVSDEREPEPEGIREEIQNSVWHGGPKSEFNDPRPDSMEVDDASV